MIIARNVVLLCISSSVSIPYLKAACGLPPFFIVEGLHNMHNSTTSLCGKGFAALCIRVSPQQMHNKLNDRMCKRNVGSAPMGQGMSPRLVL